jgi:putative nucleotidyltransferase with HDIG domain
MAEEISSRDLKYLPTQERAEFIVAFYQLLRGATLYNRKNTLIDRLTQECLQMINPLVNSEGHISLRIIRDTFFFNNVRIQGNADQYSAFRGLLHEMKKRWIGELEFKDEVNGEQLIDFVYFLSDLEENNEDNYLSILKQLEYRGLSTLQVGKYESLKDEEIYTDSIHLKQQSKEVYFRSIHFIKEAVEGITNQKMFNIRKAKRLIRDAAIALTQDDSVLLGLANIKNYGESLFNHSVNVAIYAIAIGRRIGISQKHLSHLGLAGLFHDIGKIKIPKEVLFKSERLSPEELAILQSHPIFGAEILMRMKEWDELATRMVTGALEHHLKYDLTGYPKLTRKRKSSLFSRIIALADFYDFLVRPMITHRLPYASDKIFGFMLERSGKDFDPALVKVFINLIGIFPVGTLVLLNTNEIGIVTRIQGDSEPIDRPEVCLLYYSEGDYRKGKVVDLKEKDEMTDEYKRTIVKTLNPNEYNINVGEFFI